MEARAVVEAVEAMRGLREDRVYAGLLADEWRGVNSHFKYNQPNYKRHEMIMILLVNLPQRKLGQLIRPQPILTTNRIEGGLQKMKKNRKVRAASDHDRSKQENY